MAVTGANVHCTMDIANMAVEASLSHISLSHAFLIRKKPLKQISLFSVQFNIFLPNFQRLFSTQFAIVVANFIISPFVV